MALQLVASISEPGSQEPPRSERLPAPRPAASRVEAWNFTNFLDFLDFASKLLLRFSNDFIRFSYDFLGLGWLLVRLRLDFAFGFHSLGFRLDLA